MPQIQSIFEQLGIEPTKDSTKIKKAYASMVKSCHPQEHPAEWQTLYHAYKDALRYAKSGTVKADTDIAKPHNNHIIDHCDFFHTVQAPDYETDDYRSLFSGIETDDADARQRQIRMIVNRFAALNEESSDSVQLEKELTEILRSDDYRSVKNCREVFDVLVTFGQKLHGFDKVRLLEILTAEMQELEYYLTLDEKQEMSLIAKRESESLDRKRQRELVWRESGPEQRRKINNLLKELENLKKIKSGHWMYWSLRRFLNSKDYQQYRNADPVFEAFRDFTVQMPDMLLMKNADLLKGEMNKLAGCTDIGEAADRAVSNLTCKIDGIKKRQKESAQKTQKNVLIYLIVIGLIWLLAFICDNKSVSSKTETDFTYQESWSAVEIEKTQKYLKMLSESCNE